MPKKFAAQSLVETRVSHDQRCLELTLTDTKGGRQILSKEQAEVFVRRMAQIALQPVEIVEVDDRQKVSRVGHGAFVSRVVSEAKTDADASNLGNRPDRTLERRDELLAVVR